ncbi:SAP domain protein [Aspergillus undulatus]|uniref:SAP domain protein n=1 Tax=Aspergillus undulatus TaxID=1810928 RepID=UPI003CCDD6A3
MADYSSWKVTDLKAELKRRGIPQTGLRVKQQIIDRLVEEDSKGEAEGAETSTTPADPQPEEEAQAAASETPSATEKADNNAPTQDAAPDAATDRQSEHEVAVEKPVEETGKVPSQSDSLTAPPTAPSQTKEPEKEAQETHDQEVKGVEGARISEDEAVTKPVEQAPGDAAMAEPKAIPDDAQPPAITEVTAPSAPTSGLNTETSTPLPADEVIEDVRKRKRRSQSPAPSLEEIARKKAKALGDTAPPTLPENKKDIASVQSSGGAPKPDRSTTEQEAPQRAADEKLPTDESAHRDETEARKGSAQKQDVRFKGLFSSTGREQPRASPPPVDTEMEDVSVEPALHAATAALYIDGLMRPLQPAALKNHLLSVASPPGQSPSSDLVVDFYLDTIKTHCFIRFIDVSTASRARNALHGTVWPNEKNRKSLFVDFIPEDKVKDWIQREEDARGGRGPPPRWEVKYDRRGEKIEAVLEQVDLKNSGTHAPRGPAPQDFTHPPPRGPRAEMQPKDRRPSGAQTHRSSQSGQGFKPLDELFKSTTAKPKLYYLPVSREIADKRLDRFDDLLRKGSFPRRGGDETRKFSFEDEDQFIDVGPEFAGRGRGGFRGRGRGVGMLDSRRDSRRDRY